MRPQYPVLLAVFFLLIVMVSPWTPCFAGSSVPADEPLPIVSTSPDPDSEYGLSGVVRKIIGTVTYEQPQNTPMGMTYNAAVYHLLVDCENTRFAFSADSYYMKGKVVQSFSSEGHDRVWIAADSDRIYAEIYASACA